MTMDLEVSSMQMIMHSGNSRNDSCEAIKFVKNKEFEAAEQCLEKSNSELLMAQKEHAKVLREMAESGKMETNLLLVHAEDHVSVSEMALDMARELVDVYKILGGVKKY